MLKNEYDKMINALEIRPEKIVISGGGSNSDMIMQIFADMYGATTIRSEMNDAAALGSAICAAVAAGVYDNYEDAVANMVRSAKEFTPNPENTKIYDEINTEIFQKLPSLMEPALKIMEGVFQK